MKVSLIVPAYNAEKFIERCINSLINQTLKDIEIIIVNDGSTDSTLSKVQEKAKIFKRIKLLIQENCGTGKTREIGFLQATGEYIFFLDADDWLDLRSCEKLYRKAQETQSDITLYNNFVIDEGNYVRENCFSKYLNLDNDLLKEVLLYRIKTTTMGKFIKRDFIIKNKVKFIQENICIGEDTYLTVEFFIHKPKIAFLGEHLYYYCKNKSSVTNDKSKLIKYLEINKMVYLVKHRLIEKGLYEKCKTEFDYFVYMYIFSIGIMILLGRKNFRLSKQLFHLYLEHKVDHFSNPYIQNNNIQTRLIYKLIEKGFFIGVPLLCFKNKINSWYINIINKIKILFSSQRRSREI